MKVRKLIDSFNYAVSGIIYTLKTQRNMRVHFISAFFVLTLSLFFNFSRVELLLLFFTVSLVIIAEMINTAIEKSIDMFTKEYHPLAEFSSCSLSCLIFAIVIDVIAVSELENNAENSNNTATIANREYVLMSNKLIPPITQSSERLVQ